MDRGGIFSLTTPEDLLQKARSDLQRLRQNNIDSYAAFDFFVTARHIPDWLYPKDQVAKETLFRENVELRVCRHIADQGKHFEVTDPRHGQVAKTSTVYTILDLVPDPDGATSGKATVHTQLVIVLDEKDPETAILGKRIDAVTMAEWTLAVLEVIILDARNR